MSCVTSTSTKETSNSSKYIFSFSVTQTFQVYIPTKQLPVTKQKVKVPTIILAEKYSPQRLKVFQKRIMIKLIPVKKLLIIAERN